METAFDFLNADFFLRASVYSASLGAFRYRFAPEGQKGEGAVRAWVYENVCFELAQDVEAETFPWTEEGVEALKTWLRQKLAARGTEPYRIPYPPAKAGD